MRITIAVTVGMKSSLNKFELFNYNSKINCAGNVTIHQQYKRT